MIEFKRAGDVMVFECPAFKIEVAGNGAEHIEFNDERFSSIDDVTDAFKVLDMMLERKAKHDSDEKVTEMNFKINLDTSDAEKSIDALNNKLRGALMRNYQSYGAF